jgi:hypothetical protein
MDIEIATITKRTKLGYGYSTNIKQNSQGWYIERPEKPDYEGTYNQVWNQIESDKTLAAIKSGGSYYSSSWFVKICGKWHRMVYYPYFGDLSYTDVDYEK